MKASIIHRLPGRSRFHLAEGLTYEEANAIKYLTEGVAGVKRCSISPLTGNAVVEYEEQALKNIARFFLTLDRESLQDVTIEDVYFEPVAERDFFHLLRDAVQMRLLYKFFVPMPIRIALTLYRAKAYLYNGWQSLRQGKLDVAVLDASAIGISLLTRDFKAASSTMFLLHLGEELEDWTIKKTRADLTRSLAVGVDRVYVLEGEELVAKPLSHVLPGDVVDVGMGSRIPVDGVVVEGQGMVNQASFTGESLPVAKEIGSGVFAGTVLEEGRLRIQTSAISTESRLQQIIERIEESEKNKSNKQKEAEKLADSLVKYSFLGALLTFALTRSLWRAKAFFMVDYSCALRLTIPIAVMKAMSQAGEQGILVKGGKYLENLAKADTIVFDKTGTLTQALPTVEKVIVFGPYSEDESLRIAACLEEHFPHSIAAAVGQAAKDRGLRHEEMHSEPEYIVAHGIASTINGKRAIIGSEHFVLEDEAVSLSEENKEMINRLKESSSLLYLAVDGKLVCVLCITDPIRPDAAKTIQKLRTLGVKNFYMLTGDAENAAAHIAEQLHLTGYRSQVLPEEKADFLKTIKAEDSTVIMVGDGINDSVALSQADVGISMHKGADLAREISDIAIGKDDLSSLADLILLARALQERTRQDYRFILSFNSLLIGLGLFGILSNTGSAFLHNASTVGTAMANMKRYRVLP
ncbi:heavy metal translocating P-type ATPase [uncultured Murdochiella sp.]|uniref:heavy metal translocating P-type ATPase n=1 Tax=uncultured Murdochiella sp. TaxID=1586095 RepID=UPI002805531B|nr:heavy metal translocating P-type ATPase [uncultured Murdochiella sp.]